MSGRRGQRRERDALLDNVAVRLESVGFVHADVVVASTGIEPATYDQSERSAARLNSLDSDSIGAPDVRLKITKSEFGATSHAGTNAQEQRGIRR